MNDPLSKVLPQWRTWTLSDWNDALFSYFFEARDNPAPVSRLVVTEGELAQVVQDSGTPPREIRDCFLGVLRQRLACTRHTLCTDADSFRWDPAGDVPPPFFAHLVVTCLAASEAIDGEHEGNFRARLNQLLERAEYRGSYPLNKLPRLWRHIHRWLNGARERGHSYRELVLQEVGGMQLIGYSVSLAFPGYRDRVRLEEILRESALPSPPPVPTVLGLVGAKTSSFSDRFQAAFREFRDAHSQGCRDLHRLPFWSAILDSIATGNTPARRALSTGVEALLRLELEDMSFRLALQLSGDPETRENGFRTEPAGDAKVGRFDRVLVSTTAPSAGHQLLNGELKSHLGKVTASQLYRVVSDGVLLFEECEDGDWLVAYSLPQAGEVRALVRADCSPRFLDFLSAAGATPTRSDSIYPDWVEFRGFTAAHLAIARAADWGLGNVRCLQEVIATPQIHMRGGIRLAEGWLGLRACLPHISAPLRTRVEFSRVGADRALLLERSPDDPCGWRFPMEPHLPPDLDGDFLIRARDDTGFVASRRVTFQKQVLDYNFHQPRGGIWLCESGHGDLEGLDGDRETASEVASPTDAWRYAWNFAPLTTMQGDDDPNEIDRLTEILAALTLRRRNVRESDVLCWIELVLGVHGRLVWDILRAWVEAGCLEVLVNRRWRARTLFARGPRLLALSTSDRRDVSAVLQGLVPTALRVELRRIAPTLGIELGCPRSPSPWAPRLLVFRAPSRQLLEDLSQRVPLRDIRWLLPIGDCVSPVRSVAAIQTDLLRNHVLQGVWDWSTARFAVGPVPPGEVSLQWFRRGDAPDAYVVSDGEKPLWHTRSRTWALLVASMYRGKQPFGCKNTRELVRLQGGTHLPLPVGRWAAASTGISPGPVPTNEGNDYRYTFSDSSTCNSILEALWPVDIPEALLARARWLAGAHMGLQGDSSQKLVLCPAPLREVLTTRLPRPESRAFEKMHLVAGSLLPHIRALAAALQRDPPDTRWILECRSVI